jgi:nitroreductase
MGDGKLVIETKHDLVCANSGFDKSNVPGERTVALLREDPDLSAEKIRREIKRLTGCDVAVILSHTHGRPPREGEMNVAIGVAGIKPIRDRRGEKDRSIRLTVNRGGYMGDSSMVVDVVIPIGRTHLILVARAEGLGTCWIGAFNNNELKKLVSL